MPHGTRRGARSVLPVAPFAAALILATLLAGACGGPAGTGGGGGSGGDVPPRPPTRLPTPAPDAEPVPTPDPGLISPVTGERERRVRWRFVRAAAGPAVVVEVQVGGAPCDVVTGLDVTESTHAVVLTVWAGREPGARCEGVPALLGTYQLRVPLTEPLGTRTLTTS